MINALARSISHGIGKPKMTPVKPLIPEQLYQSTNPQDFNFETTTEMEDLQEIISQPRAVQAVLFGTGIQYDGFNIFALSPSGTSI
jgi:AAA domain